MHNSGCNWNITKIYLFKKHSILSINWSMKKQKDLKLRGSLEPAKSPEENLLTFSIYSENLKNDLNNIKCLDWSLINKSDWNYLLRIWINNNINKTWWIIITVRTKMISYSSYLLNDPWQLIFIRPLSLDPIKRRIY